MSYKFFVVHMWLTSSFCLPCLQAHYIGSSQMLGPQPKGLFHDPAPGTSTADRPISVGGAYGSYPGDVRREVGSLRATVSKHYNIHRLLYNQLHTRVWTYVKYC